MNLEISTVYTRKDIEGLANAAERTKKWYRGLLKLKKAFWTILACNFWLFSLIFIKVLFTEADKQAFQVMLIGMVICIAAGFYSYSSAKAVPLGKIIWKMSPDKGERLIYRFNDDSFFFVREGAETQIAYSALYRLCEDKERFYLLLGKMEGYILPKRDIPVNLIREFQCFMENVTDLPMEQC